MLHRHWRRAALARGKAASRLAGDSPDPALHDSVILKWEDARRDHGDDPDILRGLANALLLKSEAARDPTAAERALLVLDRHDEVAPRDPRALLMRGLACAAIGEVERDEARLREGVELLVSVGRIPGTVPAFTVLALSAEVSARQGLADLTGDPRDARRAEERATLLESFAPGAAAAMGRR